MREVVKLNEDLRKIREEEYELLRRVLPKDAIVWASQIGLPSYEPTSRIKFLKDLK